MYLCPMQGKSATPGSTTLTRLCVYIRGVSPHFKKNDPVMKVSR